MSSASSPAGFFELWQLTQYVLRNGLIVWSKVGSAAFCCATAAGSPGANRPSASKAGSPSQTGRTRDGIRSAPRELRSATPVRRAGRQVRSTILQPRLTYFGLLVLTTETESGAGALIISSLSP